MKFVHIADIHVRLLKYLKQYKSIFEELYVKIKEINPDYIVIVGDVFHSKINVSNESILVVADLFRNLADITDVYIILGNHDYLVKNPDRQDSITPIIETLRHPNLHFVKKTSQIELKENFSLNIYSLVDKENWKNIKIDKSKKNIALYHGQINNCYTDTGWKIESGIEIETFSGNDFLMAGDIHLRQDISKCGYEEKEVEEEELKKYLEDNWEVVKII